MPLIIGSFRPFCNFANHLIKSKIELQDIENSYNSKETKDTVTEYKEYPYRNVILACFTFVSTGNSWGANTIGSISPMVGNLYDVTTAVVIMSSTSYLIMNIPFNFVANFFIKKFGTLVTIWTGVILTLLGCWLRNLVNYNFSWFLIGSFIAAIGNPFIANVPAKVAS